ncbi:MAG: aminodeoxychorismate/anthranilate synthase component II [Bacteroidaceae bacterium]
MKDKKILLIDNYDSFTYNLAHLLRAIGVECLDVVRNDQLTLEDIAPYTHILLSPGPGIPEEAGLLLPIIRRYAEEKPILGICLGHQAIGEAFGAKLENLKEVHHGIQSEIDVTVADELLFHNVSKQPLVGRYHSWIVSDEHFPDCLEVTARSKEGEIMALRHRTLPIRGMQFHPESILTPEGKEMMLNWIMNN